MYLQGKKASSGCPYMKAKRSAQRDLKVHTIEDGGHWDLRCFLP